MEEDFEILTNFDLRNIPINTIFESVYESVIDSASEGLSFSDFDVKPKYENALLEKIHKYLPEVILEKRGVSQDRHNCNNIKYRITWRE